MLQPEGGNGSRAEFVPVHLMVARIAAAEPAAVAIRHGEDKVTRNELVVRARRLAGGLLSRSIAPGSVIAVRLGRSIDHIVACLAILQAGSAFMSLDPADPLDRVRRMIAKAGAAAVITDVARAADHPGLAILIDDSATIGTGTFDLPAVGQDDLAYVAHTSGSTGEPNGVEITHANLANVVGWTHGAFAMTAGDRVGLTLGLGFDAAIWELWPALTVGAAVEVIDDVVRTAPRLLQTHLVDQRITLAAVPTALAEALIATEWPSGTALRYLFTGGDILRAYPSPGLPFALVNNYGPTECACETTWSIVAPRSAPEAALPPIGRAIDGVRVYLLDDDRQPVRRGEEGEIWIGGSSVGRGYRNNPELTAARFHPDPFADAGAARMYRTGDRGRLLDSGEIAFGGRVDRQVKIGGVRIELDEIALALQGHPAVASAIVTTRGGGSAADLVAYLVAADSDRVPHPVELRRFLYQRLPRSYIPRAFVVVDAMPLTRNGKVDHAALPAPEAAVSAPIALDRLGPAARAVIGIVREVLGDDRVAPGDNFFLSGGQSLQATEVVIRCRAAFGVEVALADLFGADTLEDFVETIRARVTRWVATLSDEDVAAALGRAG